MSIVLGLDVSTSVVGICVLDTQKQSNDRILLLDHVVPKGDLIDKSYDVRNKLISLKQQFSNFDAIVIEEPLMSFSKSMSSAATITTLMRFNGMCSLVVFDVFAVKPSYISASHGRKVCGIKMKRVAACGLSQKQQTFNYMIANDLKHVVWPTKKSKKIPAPTVDWAYDECDAYVLTKAYCVENALF